MRFLDMFSGTGSVGEVVKEYGHDVKFFDIDRRYGADFCADIRYISDDDFVRKFGMIDVIWASIPCDMFSVASCSTHWDKVDGYIIPKTKKAEEGLEILDRTLDLIRKANPRYYFIENPMGMMRNVKLLKDEQMATITYCQYGEPMMKKTDIWGKFPPSLIFREPCKNGDPCHESAPRGAKTGTQGLSKDDRGRVPRQLTIDIIEACERDLNYWLKVDTGYNVRRIDEDFHIEIPYNVAREHNWDENAILSQAFTGEFL